MIILEGTVLELKLMEKSKNKTEDIIIIIIL